MSNMQPFADAFFKQLNMDADEGGKHSYKAYIAQSVRVFLENESEQTAFEVYRAFFDVYRVSIPGDTNPFLDIVDLLRSYEETAATLIDKQRDHFVHMVNVFVTGLAIWQANPGYRGAFARAVPEQGYAAGFSTSEEEFFFRWGIASLLHDIGYPVEIVGNQINGFIRMVADADGADVRVKARIGYENFSELNSIAEVVPKREFTRSYYEAYESCSYVDLLRPHDLLAHHIHLAHGVSLDAIKQAIYGYVDAMADSGYIDHGYYSALIVLKWYGYAIQQASEAPERFFWPVVDAASAIFLHNYWRNYMQRAPFALGPMEPDRDPIAYLLILCDELQEWNRTARGIVTRTFTLADTVHLSLTEDYLSATYVTRHGRLPEGFCAEKVELLRTLLDLDAVFVAGFDVDNESLDSFQELRPRLSSRTGRPLLRDVELLAIAIHALYNERQLERHPGEALAYPHFSDLPDDLKYSNMRQAQGIYDRLEQFGYTLRPKGLPEAVEEFEPETLEAMAAFEHDQWVRERLASGWILGPRDVERRQSPYLVPYGELSEEIKELDRDTVRNIPLLADRIGMAVYER